MPKPDAAERVFDYLCKNANADGYLETSSVAIAQTLECPERTIQYAMKRLEKWGKVVPIARKQYIVVHMASVDDIEVD